MEAHRDPEMSEGKSEGEVKKSHLESLLEINYLESDSELHSVLHSKSRMLSTFYARDDAFYRDSIVGKAHRDRRVVEAHRDRRIVEGNSEGEAEKSQLESLLEINYLESDSELHSVLHSESRMKSTL